MVQYYYTAALTGTLFITYPSAGLWSTTIHVFMIYHTLFSRCNINEYWIQFFNIAWCLYTRIYCPRWWCIIFGITGHGVIQVYIQVSYRCYTGVYTGVIQVSYRCIYRCYTGVYTGVKQVSYRCRYRCHTGVIQVSYRCHTGVYTGVIQVYIQVWLSYMCRYRLAHCSVQQDSCTIEGSIYPV